MAKNTPNIVLIVIDAGRPDHFSCYNSKRNTTPYIDSLSKKGVIYDSAFTTFVTNPKDPLFLNLRFHTEGNTSTINSG